MGQAHFAQLAILDLHQQTVTQDARVVDQAVNGTEIRRHLLNHLDDLVFVSDIAQVVACFDTQRLARRDGVLEFFFVEVDERQACPFTCQVLGH